jgi:hypothetical protein
MQIPKDKILEMLRGQGDDDKAAQADRELPDQVDTEKHGSILERLGLNPADLIAKLAGGGGGGGGLGGLLGG